MMLARSTLSALAPLLVATSASAQYVIDNSGNPSGPGISSSSENVDFADVDLDGDWDAAFADGGDDGNDQNRLWINAGGLQGGVMGTFLDETVPRLPQVQDDSRDVEFADIDSDGDLDLYITNTAQISNQGDRWWVNQGGVQGLVLGFYRDESASRWVDLGGPGSSLPPSLLLDDTFIDWSCDNDFGDLDNDGDLDLVHSTYGGSFGGQTPTRIFLNDGNGFFSEFNPSGFKLTGTTIAPGQPALWAQGLQATDTTDTTGQFADVASSPLDIDLGDIDGDFDLDLLHGARQEAARMFANRLEEDGFLGFRDVSHAVFPPNWAFGSGNYEQEFGDLDGDGDLDFYGLNWAGFQDRTFRNDGSGVFTLLEDPVPSSGADDNEVDFVDYDNDGDLDVFVANWSGQDRLYSNDGTGLLTLQQEIGVTAGGSSSLDADAADFDKDGDYDLIIAESNHSPNTTLINVTQVPDTSAPYVPAVENDGDRSAAPGELPVRAQVYDNAPYYVTWYNATALEFEVGGVVLAQRPMVSSMGQIFRGLLPANLVGAVTYRVSSSDEYGNVGTSADQGFAASYGAPFASGFGVATAGLGGAPSVTAASVPFADSALFLALEGFAPGATWFLVATDAALPAPVSLPGLVTVNVGGTILAQFTGTANAAGGAAVEAPIGAGVPPGLSIYLQAFGVDGVGGNLLSGSPGLEVVTQ